MNEACVFLVNVYQLLVSLVPHGGVWVGSHGDQVENTLRRKKELRRRRINIVVSSKKYIITFSFVFIWLFFILVSELNKHWRQLKMRPIQERTDNHHERQTNIR